MRMLFAQSIKTAREEKGLFQKQLASSLDIDAPMTVELNVETGTLKREQVIQLSRIFDIEQDELLSLWIANKIYSVIDGEKDIVSKALRIINKTL